MSTPIEQIQEQKKLLRKQLIERRRKLTEQQQALASRKLFNNLSTHEFFLSSQHITFTLARDGEIDTLPLMLEAHRLGKHCYLPVMTTRDNVDLLVFREWQPDISLATNSYGIDEPPGKECSPADLDLVLLPLVGFDSSCNRLGMGKGYYDHTFAFIREEQHDKPVLLGLAHECQRVERLEVASWDVPLSAIVTDQAWYRP